MEDEDVFSQDHTLFYYIKVSGILSGNKLIETRYGILTCEDIDDFTDVN